MAIAVCTAVACAPESPNPSTEVTMTAQSPDQAAIQTIVESLGTFADRGEFDALARLYADEFTLDYSSLNEQPASTCTPEGLMAESAGVLPGFDRTRHAISDVEVDVSNGTARAKANVIASHWIGEGFWQVVGSYEYELADQGGRWAITAMTFNLEGESGSRDVFRPAIEAAKTKLLPGYSAARVGE